MMRRLFALAFLVVVALAPDSAVAQGSQPQSPPPGGPTRGGMQGGMHGGDMPGGMHGGGGMMMCPMMGMMGGGRIPR